MCVKIKKNKEERKKKSLIFIKNGKSRNLTNSSLIINIKHEKWFSFFFSLGTYNC